MTPSRFQLSPGTIRAIQDQTPNALHLLSEDLLRDPEDLVNFLGHPGLDESSIDFESEEIEIDQTTGVFWITFLVGEVAQHCEVEFSLNASEGTISLVTDRD